MAITAYRPVTTPTTSVAPAETPIVPVAAQAIPADVKPALNRAAYPLGNDDAKSRRILRQGVYQAVLQSPGLAGLGFTNKEAFLKLVEEAAEHVIGLVEK